MRTIRDSCFIVTCLSLQLKENVKIIINLNKKNVINDITVNVTSVKLNNTTYKLQNYINLYRTYRLIKFR